MPDADSSYTGLRCTTGIGCIEHTSDPIADPAPEYLHLLYSSTQVQVLLLPIASGTQPQIIKFVGSSPSQYLAPFADTGGYFPGTEGCCAQGGH